MEWGEGGGLCLDMPSARLHLSCFQEGTSDSTAQSTEEHSGTRFRAGAGSGKICPGGGAGEGAP